MKRSHMILGATAVLAVASLALTVPASAEQQYVVQPRIITVSGMAERKVVPDEAHITVNLNAMDKSLATAKSLHDAKLKKLMEITKDAGIDDKKVRTQSSSIQPIYHYVNDAQGRNQRIFDGYRAQSSIDVTVVDASKIGALMDKIANAGFEKGANTEWGNLLNLYYTLSNPDEIRDEILADAIANARKKAERMADASGASLGKVYQINEGGTPMFQPQPMPMMAMAKMESAGAADAAYAPPAGEQNVNANVTVSFILQ